MKKERKKERNIPAESTNETRKERKSNESKKERKKETYSQ